jgi:hypothetical protein
MPTARARSATRNQCSANTPDVAGPTVTLQGRSALVLFSISL